MFAIVRLVVCGKEGVTSIRRSFALSTAKYTMHGHPLFCNFSAANTFPGKTQLCDIGIHSGDHNNVRPLRNCTHSDIAEYGKKTTWKVFQRDFQTSAPRSVHPLLLALIKPLSRIVPMVLGRRFRRWWKGLSEEDKSQFRKDNKKYAYVFGGMLQIHMLNKVPKSNDIYY